MTSILPLLDGFLRGQKRFDPAVAQSRFVSRLLLMILCTAPLYGLIMGSYSVDTVDRIPLSAFAALKMPLLLLATTATCLPGFFALNTVLRLREDFGQAFHAILAGQTGLSIVLASLAPLTIVWYLSVESYRAAILFNAIMFSLATAAGQCTMLRYYRPLIRRRRAHAWALGFWLLAYSFVGIQMGWMLRPFVGSPGKSAQFFRDEPFSNAYVIVARLLTEE